MIQEFVKAWNENKNRLKEYFMTHQISQYNEYKDLVFLLFDLVINPYLSVFDRLDIDKMHIIDDGDYQGDYVFLIHKDCPQPKPCDYIVTTVDYGSCSGCDTLLGIISKFPDEDIYPKEEETNEYMTLCLHLLQKCKYLYTEDESFNKD